MKTLLTILGVITFVLISSSAIYRSKRVTSKSTEQVVFHSNNVQVITDAIKLYHRMGYRVTNTISQSIAYDLSSSNSSVGQQLGYIQRGEILVIMER
jgi:hypothetical protein